MQTFTEKKIIVPWDFSDRSHCALKEALKICKSQDQIEVVHITPYPSTVEPSIVWGVNTEDDIRQRVEKLFHEEMEARGHSDIKFSASFGDPGSRIAEIAEKCGAGLIVISSHGRTGLTRMLLGSVAERVVRLAPCPVLVLREPKSK